MKLNEANKCDSSLIAFENILVSLDSIENHEFKIKVFNQLALTYYNCNKYDESARYYRHCIKLKIKNGIHNLASEYLGLSYIYLDRGLTDSSLAHIDTANLYMDKNNDTIISSFIENQSGRIYMAKGQFDIALKHFYLGLENAYNNKDTAKLVQAHTNIGSVYIKLNEGDKALDSYITAFDLSKMSNNQKGMACSYSIGVFYKKRGEYDKALHYYSQAIVPCIKLNRIIDLVNIYSNMANVYNLQKKHNEAYKCLQKSISISSAEGMQRQLGIAYANMGDTKKFIHQHDSAIYYFDKSLSVFEKMKAYNLKSTLLKLKSNAYAYNNDFKNALFYYKEHINLSKSIYSKDVAEKIAEIETKYETEKKEKENITLRADNEMKKLSLSIKNIIIYSLIAGVSIILLLLALTFRQYKQKDKAYQVLVRQNLKIASSELKELESQNARINLASDQGPNSKKSESEEEKMFKELISKLIQYFKDEKPYLDCKLNLDDLSKFLNTNRSYLSRAINEYMNKGFYELLNEYRLNEARLLLIDKHYDHISIDGIGQMVGFSSRSSFYNSFKIHFGITPSYFKQSVPQEHKIS